MSTIEILALVLIVFSFIKLIVIAINPQLWYGPTNPLMKLPALNHNVVNVVFLILVAIILFFLLTEINIVQIFVAMFLGVLLVMIMFVSNLKKIIEMLVGDTTSSKDFYRRYWFPSVVWLVLMIWVLWKIFYGV